MMDRLYWGDKRYYNLNYFYRKKFQTKVVKLPLNCGFTCPNRDGKVGYGGCIFCSQSGSGDFTADSSKSLFEQSIQIKQILHKKWPNVKYIAYLQSFTNTYAPIDILKKKYCEALKIPDTVGLSIATRPDCIGTDVLNLLKSLSRNTYISVEMGLQTSNENTAKLINRCYSLDCFEAAVKNLRSLNIDVVVHLIMGLPFETKNTMLDTVRYISSLDIQGVKFQMLYILENTKISYMYNQIDIMNLNQYIDLISDFIEILPQSIVIHRLTGDAPQKSLIAPNWIKNKRAVLNGIDLQLKLRDSWQSKYSK